jgi:hypothetical protein
MPNNNPATPNANSKGSLVAALSATSDRWVQLAIIAVVTLFGGGNFLVNRQTHDTTLSTHADVLQAVREIHQLYDKVDDFEQRQKDELRLLDELRRAQK